VNLRPIIALVRRHLRADTGRFLELCALGKRARQRGYYTRGEFKEICLWKSPRVERLLDQNSEASIKRHTREALRSAAGQDAVLALMRLAGVRVPMASALLAAYAPRKFGVIDVRAWRMLHDHGCVQGCSSGKNLQPRHWVRYQELIRDIAKQLDATPRLVELALYEADRFSGRKIDGTYRPAPCLDNVREPSRLSRGD
jgi:hypothetical protein